MGFYLTIQPTESVDEIQIPPVQLSARMAARTPHRGPKFTSVLSTKYTDDETGLVMYQLRAYSPGLGRWITRDPAGEEGGVNLYGMCANDVMSHFDYLGRTFDWGTWYVTRPKSSSITFQQMDAAATKTISLFKEFDMTIKFFDVALDADRTPRGLFNWFSYDLVNAIDRNNLGGVLDFLHGNTVDGHQLRQVVPTPSP